MKDIHEVLRRKQAKYAQLGKQIEALQQVAEKLREVAPLLSENDDEDDNVVLAAPEEEPRQAMAARASAMPAAPANPAAQPANTAAAPAKPATRGVVPRWP
jgi:hypothetical protein